MSHDNRKWVIITLASYNDEQLENLCGNAIQTSVSTLRKTLDGTKAILKWDGDTPSCFDGMTTYNHSEILTELAKSSWNDEG